MSKLVFWPAPREEYDGTDQVQIKRGTSESGPFEDIALIYATDSYGEWVTHYLDEDGTDSSWYVVILLDNGEALKQREPEQGTTPYSITPQDVIDVMQGLPMNFVDAKHIQTWITRAIDYIEKKIRMKLKTTSVVKERYGQDAYDKIAGIGRGLRTNKIKLRQRPVQSVEAVFYQVRGSTTDPNEWRELDIEVEYDGDEDGYNPGIISIVPRALTTTYDYVALLQRASRQRRVNILISYTHGFSEIPPSLEESIVEFAASQVMEIAGQAETAGLASRSIDGYSESFTASATTTQFSALRMYYDTRIKEIMKLWRKPLYV